MGGSTTTQAEIPEYLENASKNAINASQQAAAIGYVPYSGPDVAAMTDMQNAAFQGTNAAASAYGLPTAANPSGMPAPTTYAGGVQGYSAMPMYEQALADLKKMYPGQYDAIMAMFVNPQTGAAPSNGLLTGVPETKAK